MARVGGQIAVAGFSFQAWAIARAIVDVYRGNFDFVRAEVPPHADFGQAGIIPIGVDDYVIHHAKTRIYHQAKSNAPGSGPWTPNKLWKEEILQDFVKQLEADSASECCLVTSSDCPLLGEVADRARDAIMEAMGTGQFIDQTSIKIHFSERSVFAKPKAIEIRFKGCGDKEAAVQSVEIVPSPPSVR